MNNELIIEGLYEDFLDEAEQSGNLPMYTEQQIHEEVMTRFFGQPSQLEFYL